MEITQATHTDLPVVHDLLWDYLQWANREVDQAFLISFDIVSMLEHDMEEIAKFMPPKGRLLLARTDTGVVGCACMRTLGPGVAEVKRIYVRPEQRRAGIGRALLDALIADLQATGYSVLRLDSARFMHEAHALYRARGFQEIGPYPESEIPQSFWSNWLFMELPLGKVA